MTQDILVPALREMLASGDTAAVRDFAESQHPADLADCLNFLEAEEAWGVLALLPRPQRAAAFGYLHAEPQVALAHAIGRAELTQLFGDMDADERADLYNRLEPEQQEALLPALAQAERDDIRKLSGYAEGTAGAIMTSEYATLAPELTARAAIERLRLEAPSKETIYQAFVIDEDRRLLGAVSLEDLILAPAQTRVGALMHKDPPCARVDEDQQEVARKVAHYDVLALPVINGGERLVGIVTYDDAMDVAEAEATEDFHRHGSVVSIPGSVRDASFSVLYRKRVFWLVILVFGNIFSGAGIAYFEDTIAAYVALVFFLPLLIDSGGNAGSQSATLMVRALATGDVVMKDWASMLGREVVVALGLGLTMAAAVSLLGVVRGGPDIAMVVAITMVLVVIVGSLIGMSLPFVLSRFKFDPATASAPLITSIADAAGVLIYFGMATAILGLPAET